MANIGATTAFYKVETSLTRANNEVSKSMERLATGKQNATAGDRSSYQAMADTFRLDYVATKAGLKGASVVMGYLETAMRTLDAASGVLSRLQELAVLGANETNTTEDALAIDSEAEALADEFHRLLNTAKYKGKDLFLAAAGGEYVSLGGRDAEMTFGVKKVEYQEMYIHTSYVAYATEVVSAGNTEALALADLATSTMVNGRDYKIQTVSSTPADFTSQGSANNTAGTDFTANKNFNLGVGGDGGSTDGKVAKQVGQLVFTASEGANVTTNSLTAKIESVQGKINTARVQAGSQYAALESAVGYVTDLTAQYELGYNAVNDVNFSMETAHLAKNQILQQAATAMLAQANQGQQSLLQLIQG
jgi:flagellin